MMPWSCTEACGQIGTGSGRLQSSATRDSLQVAKANRHGNGRHLQGTAAHQSGLSSPEARCIVNDLTDFVPGVLAADCRRAKVLKLFLTLTNGADRIDPSEFHPLSLPFLRSLLSVPEKHSRPLKTPRYHHIFAAIFKAYLWSWQRSLIQATVCCMLLF